MRDEQWHGSNRYVDNACMLWLLFGRALFLNKSDI
jgi:hypothetical protein